MTDILTNYQPITLEEMSGIRLMNRTDTKFVTNIATLRKLLKLAVWQYRAQEIEGKRQARYYTMYFDTPDMQMYTCHHSGHANRQKLAARIADAAAYQSLSSGILVFGSLFLLY